MSRTVPPKRRGQLSKEDTELWADVAATLEPLRRGKARIHRDEAQSSGVLPKGTAAKAVPPPKPPKGGQTRTAPERPAPPTASGTAAFDKSAARKLKRGQAEIEARVDLHGLRQGEAHAALRRFLTVCHGRGQRLVLVITGKGAARDDRPDDLMGERTARGVIRRSVPLWLTEPELSAIVVGYAPAAARHGGDGALYVHLRRPERVRR